MIASLVALAAFAVLEVNFDPLPVGINAAEAAIDLDRFTHVPPPIVTASLIGQLSSTHADSAGTAVDPQSAGAMNDRAVMEQNVRMLEKTVEYLESVPDYTATFFKREAVSGVIGDGQVIQLKLRHQPFSVYMKWLVGDKGRELLYVDGENDGNMLVKVGGVRGRLIPCIKLDPNGSMALAESRHPVTEAGLLNLTSMLLKHRRQQLAAAETGVKCRYSPNQEIDGHNCWCYIYDFATPDVLPPYRRSVQYFENEHGIPVCIMNYGWDEGAGPSEQSLIEHYGYSDIRLNQRLADADFDRGNSKYSLRR